MGVSGPACLIHRAGNSVLLLTSAGPGFSFSAPPAFPQRTGLPSPLQRVCSPPPPPQPRGPGWAPTPLRGLSSHTRGTPRSPQTHPRLGAGVCVMCVWDMCACAPQHPPPTARAPQEPALRSSPPHTHLDWAERATQRREDPPPHRPGTHVPPFPFRSAGKNQPPVPVPPSPPFPAHLQQPAPLALPPPGLRGRCT